MQALLDYVRDQKTTGFLVIHDGKVVVERNWPAPPGASAFKAAVDHPASHINTLAFSGVPLALWSGKLDRAEAGVAALRQEPSLANREVWRRLTLFFDAAVRHAQGEPEVLDEMGDAQARIDDAALRLERCREL